MSMPMPLEPLYSSELEVKRLRNLARWKEEGRRARRAGKGIEDNDHVTTPAREAWWQGWMEEDASRARALG